MNILTVGFGSFGAQCGCSDGRSGHSGFHRNLGVEHEKGENLGMVAALQETLSITQTSEKITIDSTVTFQGKVTERQINYDLAGAPVVNFAAMGDRSETVSQWEDGGLVTTWTSEGAIAGTEVVRTETRKLAGDGMTMTIRTARGDTPAMVRVYEKQE